MQVTHNVFNFVLYLDIVNGIPVMKEKQYYQKNRIKICQLRKENRRKYPEKLREIENQYRLKNPQKVKNMQKNYRENVKLTVFLHYSNGILECECCKIKGLNFLTIDHIYIDGGYKDRKISHGLSLYRWLIKNNFPKGFQVLCWNCNHAKFYNGGTCPHILIEGDEH